MHTVVETPMFLRATAAIFTDEERAGIVAAVALEPEGGDVMPGTGGYRKRRFARAGMGKRGGARVIYLYVGPQLPVFLITAYAKSDKGNLSKAEQTTLAKAAKDLVASYGGGR